MPRRSRPQAVHAASAAVQTEVAALYSSVLAPIFLGLAVAYAVGVVAALLLPNGRLSDELERPDRGRDRRRNRHRLRPATRTRRGDAMSHHPTIAIVGSGPIGATYARTLLEGLPDARVIMFEAGPQITDRPGRERPQHRGPRREGACARAVAGAAGRRSPRVARHPVGHGRGGHVHRAPGHAPVRLRRRGLGARADVRGRGRRDQRRRPGLALDLRDAVARLQREDPVHPRRRVGRADRRRRRACCTCRMPPSRTPRSARRSAPCSRRSSPRSFPRATASAPCRSPATRSRTDRCAGAARTSCSARSSIPSSPLSERFELRDLSLVRRVEREGDRVTGVTVEDLRTRETSFVAADLVVVAADAFRSPQLLWASGIRPAALGRYLTEHPVVITTVALDAEKMSRFATEEQLDAELAQRAKHAADPVAAVNRIPFSEPDHPFSLQVMYSENTPFPLPDDSPFAGNRWGFVNMGNGLRKRPRVEDGLTFTDDELDYRGFPNFTVDYELTDAELAEIEAATADLRRVGETLGDVRRRAAAHAERLEPALHGHDADGRDRRRHLGRRPVLAGVGGRRARRRRQRPDPDGEHDEPDAHERRDRGARRAEGDRGALGGLTAPRRETALRRRDGGFAPRGTFSHATHVLAPRPTSSGAGQPRAMRSDMYLTPADDVAPPSTGISAPVT